MMSLQSCSNKLFDPLTPQVVHFLISNGYLLSALELLVEAEQSGDDQAIGKLLGPFFDNPSHFPPEELAKCDGDDGGAPPVSPAAACANIRAPELPVAVISRSRSQQGTQTPTQPGRTLPCDPRR